jgi:hypothetical protein
MSLHSSTFGKATGSPALASRYLASATKPLVRRKTDIM